MPSKPKVFRPGGSKTQAELDHAYDNRRGSARERGYDARWDRASAAFKMRYPLCLGCQAVGRVTATFLVDHVVPHRGDKTAFWNEALWQAACEWHGNAIKQQLEALYSRGKITKDDLWLNSAVAVALTRRR